HTLNGTKYQTIHMNPKSFTATQMFGALGPSGDWTDGIFSSTFRRACKREDDHIWLVLDGPIDTIWIESLNTCLDDNKLLTLANSDRIPMSRYLKLVFEIDSLDNASPATVSRAGIIYMSDKLLGWKPVLKAWIKERTATQAAVFEPLFMDLLDELQKYVEIDLTPMMDIPFMSPAVTLMNILETLLPKNDPTMKAKDIIEFSEIHLKRIFSFAAFWAFGSLLEWTDRKAFTERVLGDAGWNTPPVNVAKEETVFDYFVNDNGEWRHWNEKVDHYEYPSEGDEPDFSSILIPTVDNTRVHFLLEKLVLNGFPVLLLGESGTAKTVSILSYLESQPEDVVTRRVNFSSATTHNIFQNNIEEFVEKRMGNNYGPPAGKRGIIFVDDFNMVEVNEWGDMPTNEIVRQLIESRMLYSLEKPGDWFKLDDLFFVAAMQHPGGGRNDIPRRLKRQFSVFNVTLPSATSVDHIYGTIIEGHFSEERGFSGDVVDMSKKLTSLMRLVWSSTKAKMLPTPAKLHYIFNLRDLSRITQGILRSTPEKVNDAVQLLQLWRHECCRVLPDKFTNQQDTTWFDNRVLETLQ
ncbi:Dynein heavy chain, partial [Aduncisulcus paluster]